jgi:hypothetical protein
MSSTLNEPGLYLLPNMAPGVHEAQYQQKVARGPSGMPIYFPKGDFAFGKSLAIEFGAELVPALLAAFPLSLTGPSTFSGRLGFCALIGLIAAISTNISYWNWCGFPTPYISAYAFTGWMGFLCAGLLAAALKVGGPVSAARAVGVAAPMAQRMGRRP